jgi:hypothetical protein
MIGFGGEAIVFAIMAAAYTQLKNMEGLFVVMYGALGLGIVSLWSGDAQEGPEGSLTSRLIPNLHAHTQKLSRFTSTISVPILPPSS